MNFISLFCKVYLGIGFIIEVLNPYDFHLKVVFCLNHRKYNMLSKKIEDPQIS